VNGSMGGGSPGFIGAVLNNNAHNSSLTEYNVACIGQAMYISPYPPGNTLVGWAQPPNEPNVKYANCTLNDQKARNTLDGLEGTWSFSNDLSQMNLQPSDSVCILPMTLDRHNCNQKPTYEKVNGHFDIEWDGSTSTKRRHQIPVKPAMSGRESAAVLHGMHPFRAN